MPADDWDAFHDATLRALELRWSEGRIDVRVTTVHAPKSRTIVGRAVTNLECPRRHPWGPSRSVNEIHAPIDLDSGGRLLEIEMQSGDVVRVHASSFEIVLDG